MSFNNATTTNLTTAIIKSASSDVSTYVSTIQNLNNQLATIMQTLAGEATFAGDASVGYQTFYKETVVPAVDTNLIKGDSCLTAGIISMLNTIQSHLIGTVDPQLGNANKNPGAQEG